MEKEKREKRRLVSEKLFGGTPAIDEWPAEFWEKGKKEKKTKPKKDDWL